MIWNRVKHSTIDKLMQYVLIELFRNVFLEKTMIESVFPINPIAITETWAIVIANEKYVSDIFPYFFFLLWL